MGVADAADAEASAAGGGGAAAALTETDCAPAGLGSLKGGHLRSSSLLPVRISAPPFKFQVGVSGRVYERLIFVPSLGIKGDAVPASLERSRVLSGHTGAFLYDGNLHV